MATYAGRVGIRGDERFFFTMAVLMALTLVAGFSLQLAMGRSSFHSPLLLHAHALTFFGWTLFYVLQNGLVASGAVAQHRRLGWIGAFWATAMVVLGTAVTVAMIRRGDAPFFFQPLRFLLMDCLALYSFAGLLAAGIVLRRRTAWHRRLIYCGMAILTGPGWGRLLPMPLLIPYADWAVYGAIMVWPLVGVIADLRRTGTVHPAWLAGIVVILAQQLLVTFVATSAPGASLYAFVTVGSPGAAVPAMAFPPMPPL